MALLCGLACQIFQLVQSLALEILVRHILGKWNVLADSLSRRSPVQMEWDLNQLVFQAIVACFWSVASGQSVDDSPELQAARV